MLNNEKRRRKGECKRRIKKKKGTENEKRINTSLLFFSENKKNIHTRQHILFYFIFQKQVHVYFFSLVFEQNHA
jgi:hypothetical protein